MKNKTIFFTVLVGALGYFVDIYDLLIFGIVRTPSLRAIGIAEPDLMPVGLHILNMQMVGTLAGGILWGILGDKRGRKSVMFGSIVLYSTCNILNAFVTTADQYAWLRFFAGVGLAGELGAAITLVTEVMPKETRGYGTAIVASVGILGAVFAAMIGDIFDWKMAYLTGGAMGLGLLIMRAGLLESGMFKAMSESKTKRGQFHKLFLNPRTFLRYLCCILIGVPIWYVIGILITFAPELSQEIGVVGSVTGAHAIMWSYLGLSIGDFSAGLLSQYFRSRKKAVFVFLAMTSVLVAFYVFAPVMSSALFYLLCGCLGLGTGYWATFITVGAEQFGTNIRATVATTIPNFVRAAVVPMTLAFSTLKPQVGVMNAVLAVGVTVLAIAFVALFFLHETFSKDLDYHEAH